MGSWGRAWSMAEVRDFIGHCSVGMTERYAHLGPGHLKALAAETKIVHRSSTPRQEVEAVPVAAKRNSEASADELGNSCSIQLSYAVVIPFAQGTLRKGSRETLKYHEIREERKRFHTLRACELPFLPSSFFPACFLGLPFWAFLFWARLRAT
jgi:hypothetical protein